MIGVTMGLIASCAQVGFLTGGEEDVHAPEPIHYSPENGSVSFSGKEVKMYFGEFVLLKNPEQNIFMVPNDVKINTVLNKKTLALDWEEMLQPNTTYVIYMNNAVTDVSEGNGKLLKYVFSTGAELDTLVHTFRIRDALTNVVAPKTTVGLFTHEDSLKPLYFSVSDDLGIARFRYLKEGKYIVRAFQDENNDLRIGASEACGFLTDSINVSPIDTDTSEIRLFNPFPSRLIQRFDYQGPSVFELELVQPLHNPLFEINGEELNSEYIRQVSEKIYRLLPVDSIHQITNLKLIVGPIRDSSSLRITAKERSAPISIHSVANVIPLNKPLIFELNSNILETDTSKIRVYSSKDSLTAIPYKIDYEQDLLYLWPHVIEGGSFRILFSEGAINSASKPHLMSFEIKAKKELGTFQLQPEGFDGPLIIDLLKDKKLVDQRKLPLAQTVVFDDLIPDEYTFRVVEDTNGNGIWDTGDLRKKLQPEMVSVYDVPIRIRPNWGTKLTVKAKN
jgi:uncharacterized protein (DUF2141 family)